MSLSPSQPATAVVLSLISQIGRGWSHQQSEKENFAVLERSFMKMIGLKRYIAQYLKKFWTDLDKIWWAGWLCDDDELIIL